MGRKLPHANLRNVSSGDVSSLSSSKNRSAVPFPLTYSLNPLAPPAPSAWTNTVANHHSVHRRSIPLQRCRRLPVQRLCTFDSALRRHGNANEDDGQKVLFNLHLCLRRRCQM